MALFHCFKSTTSESSLNALIWMMPILFLLHSLLALSSPTSFPLEEQAEMKSVPYLNAVGALQYLATMT
jgi:hypothetical protein